MSKLELNVVVEFLKNYEANLSPILAYKNNQLRLICYPYTEKTVIQQWDGEEKSWKPWKIFDSLITGITQWNRLVEEDI